MADDALNAELDRMMERYNHEDYLQKNKIWVTQQGQQIKMSDMTTYHLTNTIKMLHRKGLTYLWQYEALKEELNKRLE